MKETMRQSPPGGSGEGAFRADAFRKNDTVCVRFESVSENGEGVGRAPDGRTLFCFGALAGETAEVRIVKVSRSYYVGKLCRLLPETVSPDRREADCSAFARCGGCAFRHMTYAASLRVKAQYVQDCLQRIGGLPAGEYEKEDILPSPEILGYRNKTVYQFASCGEEKQLACGFYRRNSHDLVSCETCLADDPRAAAVRRTFLSLAREAGLSAYDETTGKGLLRNLTVRTSQAFPEAMVVIVINGDRLPEAESLVASLVAACPFVVSVYLNLHKQRSNAVAGKRFVLLYGKAQLEDAIGETRFLISPQSFFQVNPYQTERLYRKAAEFAALRDGETLLDLYCGIGTIGIFLAEEAAGRGAAIRGLLGVEFTEQAVRDARENAARNGLAGQAVFLAGDAPRVMEQIRRLADASGGCALPGGEAEETAEYARAAALCRKIGVALLDPPRKGCDEALLASVVSFSPERIVYVSCSPATLARDVRYLTENGYRAEKVCPVDMFPYCGHVETVCLLSRHNGKLNI